MDFLAASQNVDNNNTHKIPCYMSIRLSNSTQMQTHEIQNKEAGFFCVCLFCFFQLTPPSVRNRKCNASTSFIHNQQ